MEVREFDWDSSRKGASQLPRTTNIRLSTPKTTTGEILIFALTSPLGNGHTAAFPTDEEAAAIADEADIVIRSLGSRVIKMEKSGASALSAVRYRLARIPVACDMVTFWCTLDGARLENSDGSLNQGHDSSIQG